MAVSVDSAPLPSADESSPASTTPASASENLPGAVSGSIPVTVEKARYARACRRLAAQRLLENADAVPAPELARSLNAIDLDALDQLPQWVLLDSPDLLELQSTSTAVFIAPSLRLCLEGQVLKTWRSLLGADRFEAALQQASGMSTQSAPGLPDAQPQTIALIGARLLLSSVATHPAYRLIAARFSPVESLIDEQTAIAVVTLAINLQQKLEQGVTDGRVPGTEHGPPAGLSDEIQGEASLS